MPLVAGLLREHADLNRRSMQLRRILSQPVLPDMAEYEMLTRTFSDKLIAHLAAENVLLPALAEHSDPRIARIGISFRDDMDELVGAYSHHLARWPRAAIEADWAGYGAELCALLDRLSARILRENRVLYPLFAQEHQRAG